MIFKGNLKASEVENWLKMFQVEVDKLAGSNYLKFTAKVWGEDKNDGSIQEAVMVRGEDSFLYLNMEMVWSERGELQFSVHLKVNQQLKYLNRGSTHTEACFQVIPRRVLRCLATLTTETEELKIKRMNELYPSHAKALKVAKLAPEVFPTLGKILRNVATKPERKDRNEKQWPRQKDGTFLSWHEQTLEHTNSCELEGIV